MKPNDTDNDVRILDFDGDQDYIVAEFKIAYPSVKSVDTTDKVLKLVSIDSDVRSWYIDVKKQRSISSSKPEWLESTRQHLDAWNKLDEKRAERKLKEANWSSEVEIKSKALKETVRKVEAERAKFFSSMDDLLIIDSISVNQLPINDKIELIQIEDDQERREFTKRKILTFQGQLFEEYINGGLKTDPFFKG
jgi:hypothetical protein